MPEPNGYLHDLSGSTSPTVPFRRQAKCIQHLERLGARHRPPVGSLRFIHRCGNASVCPQGRLGEICFFSACRLPVGRAACRHPPTG